VLVKNGSEMVMTSVSFRVQKEDIYYLNHDLEFWT